MNVIQMLGIKVFADCAHLTTMVQLRQTYPWIQGFTTNPTLMKKAGVQNYRAFAIEAAGLISLPISFEVVADEDQEMEAQARVISSWAENIYVKIPVVNTRGESMASLIQKLSHDDIKCNVTAVFTAEQADEVKAALKDGAPAFLSVFAGRIADTGVDPTLIVMEALEKLPDNVDVIWASSREVFDVRRAAACGCHVVTLSPDLLAKVATLGKDLNQYSVETVRQFFMDAKAAGYTL
jgi:transaldolase